MQGDSIGFPDVTALWPLLTLAGLAAAVYLIGFCWRSASLAKSVIKTAAVGLLALAALVSPSASVALVVALGLCALGDLLLSREGEAAFLGGVGAFAAGHLAYVTLFLSHSDADFAHIPLGAVMVLALFGLAMIAVLFKRAGRLRWAVVAYVPVILSMGLSAFALPPAGALALVLPAAIAFMLSDTVLAAELFLLSERHPLRRITPFVVWSTYWGAQLGFFLGLAGGG